MNSLRSNNITRQTFTVTVVPVAPPTLDPISSMTIADNAGVQTIPLTGISDGTGNGNEALRVSASSSNPRVILMPSIQYASPSSTGVLTFKPTAKSVGNWQPSP